MGRGSWNKFELDQRKAINSTSISSSRFWEVPNVVWCFNSGNKSIFVIERASGGILQREEEWGAQKVNYLRARSIIFSSESSCCLWITKHYLTLLWWFCKISMTMPTWLIYLLTCPLLLPSTWRAYEYYPPNSGNSETSSFQEGETDVEQLAQEYMVTQDHRKSGRLKR